MKGRGYDGVTKVRSQEIRKSGNQDAKFHIKEVIVRFAGSFRSDYY